MVLMTPVHEIIVFIIVLLVALAGLTLLFFVSMHRFLQARRSSSMPRSGLNGGADPSKIDPWSESGRRMRVESGESPDSDSDEDVSSGGRFE